jgi:hypothetical protein
VNVQEGLGKEEIYIYHFRFQAYAQKELSGLLNIAKKLTRKKCLSHAIFSVFEVLRY